ncbi:MAG: D-alanyl-D-alanine endopeptidase [Burkholderiaceae bacterium]|nr:D-alanyl-D-alanine endopeptidase [Burkholderiaceae bacterium]
MANFSRQALVLLLAVSLPVTFAFASSTTSETPTKKHITKKHITTKRVIVKTAGGHTTRRTVVALRKEKVVAERPSAGDIAGLSVARTNDRGPVALQSNVAYVVDQESSKVLFDKNSDVSLPIASITKLMTSLIVMEANQDMNEILEVTDDDVDREKNTSSRLHVGAKLSRADMLHIALMSSENRAASALGRNYPGGIAAFVAAMNAKAAQLGMHDTHYVDSSGLSSQNVASAQDLVKLINVAYKFPLIREYSTDSKYVVNPSGHPLQYSTTNKLVASSGWDIGLQKTGYIAEAGRCLVMHAMIEGRAVVMVFLDSKGKYSRLADAARIRKWLETVKPQG